MSRTILAARRASAGGAPVNTVPPSISGTVAHGSVLTATPGTWTGSPSITGQWYAGASPISGETGTTYTVDRTDTSIGPDITYRESDSVSGTHADSNALAYYPTQDFRAVWDAAEDVTLVGADVDAWLDQGPGAMSMAAAASGNRPAHSASDANFNGEPSVTFDGGTEYLRVVAASMGGALSYYAPGGCLRVGAGVTNNDVLVSYNNAHLLRMSVGAGVPYLSATGNSVATTDVRSSTRCISGAVQYGSTQSIYVSGTAEDTDVNATSGPADGLTLSVGGTSTGTLTAPVSTALVVVGTSAASASSRAALDLEAYCAWRFGAV